jgi:hypothetical protein
MVSSSCSTCGRSRVTLVMVSSSWSTSGRVRVTLVMVSSSWSTSGRGRVTLVMVTVPPLLVTEVHKSNTTATTSRAGTAYHHKSNTISVTREQELLSIARLTRPLSLVEEELLPSQE